MVSNPLLWYSWQPHLLLEVGVIVSIDKWFLPANHNQGRILVGEAESGHCDGALETNKLLYCVLITSHFTLAHYVVFAVEFVLLYALSKYIP